MLRARFINVAYALISPSEKLETYAVAFGLFAAEFSLHQLERDESGQRAVRKKSMIIDYHLVVAQLVGSVA